MTVVEALRSSDPQWRSDGRPTLVLLFDGTREAHLRAIQEMESDDRIKAGSWFFRCFRVDERAAAGAKIRLLAYLPDGTLVGEDAGDRRLPDAFALLERTFELTARTELNEHLPWVTESLVRRYAVQKSLAEAEAQIVCSHCGNCEAHIVQAVERLRTEKRQHDEAFERGLRLFRQP